MIKRRSASSLLDRANVNLVYEKDGKIIVGVENKLPLDALAKEDVVPDKVEGKPTDVIETGLIEAYQKTTDWWRPAPGGVSIGHIDITAGTLGCIVLKDGRRMILSNNHVLADSNDGSIGDDILQPGPYDLGGGDGCIFSSGVAGFFNAAYWLVGRALWLTGLNPRKRPTTRFETYESILYDSKYLIGHLHKFAPIDFGGGYNRADCALAMPLNDDVVRDDILNIGVPTKLGRVDVGDRVRKYGRTTGLTDGIVEAIDAFINVNYGNNKVARYENQIITNWMLDGGDSGSILLAQDSLTIVGLCFAGSSNTGVMNNISDVYDALGGFECVG